MFCSARLFALTLGSKNIDDCCILSINSKSRVSEQNGISLQWYIVEIYHSGQKPVANSLNNYDHR